MIKKKKDDNSKILLQINKEFMSVIEIKNKTITAFNSIKTSIGLFNGNKISNKDLLEAGIRLLTDNIELNNDSVTLVLTEDNVTKQTVEIDIELNDSEILIFIKDNFKKISDNLNYDDFYFDYYESRNINKNKKEIIIYLAKKTDINILESSLYNVGLKVKKIEVESIALERFVKNNLTNLNNENNTIGFFNLNKENTHLSFFKNGKRIFYFTSEEYTLKQILEADTQKGKNDDDDDGFELVLSDNKIFNKNKEKEKEKEDIKTEVLLSESANNFIDFVNYNKGLVDSHGEDDHNFIIFLSINESELDFKFSDIEKKLKNTKIITANPIENFDVHKNVNQQLLKKVAPRIPFLIGSSLNNNKNESNINLHDWRSELKKIANKNYQNLVFLLIMIAGIIIMALHINANNYIKKQKSINNKIAEFVKADKVSIEQITILKANKKKIINKIDTINNLQIERPQIVHLLTGIVDSTPKEVHLISFNRTYNKYIKLTGKSIEEKQIFEMVKNLENSNWFFDVKITKIHNADNGVDKNDPLYQSEYDFEIQMKEKNLKTLTNKEVK